MFCRVFLTVLQSTWFLQRGKCKSEDFDAFSKTHPHEIVTIFDERGLLQDSFPVHRIVVIELVHHDEDRTGIAPYLQALPLPVDVLY